MPLDLIDDKSTWVQVMAWCHQAPSHYLSQCWLRSMSLYGITRPQWVNEACCWTAISSATTMMTSSNGSIFHVTGPLCGEFTGHWWIPHTGQWRGALMFSLICAWINGWVNNREAGDLRCYRAHYDVIVMAGTLSCSQVSASHLKMWYL